MTSRIPGLTILLLICIGHVGCISPFRVHLPSIGRDKVEALRADLDRLFADPQLTDIHLGAAVYSLDRDEALYEKGARSLYIPASVNKVITAAAALTQLGPEFRFETRVSTDGAIEQGVLQGNLIVAGSGDPSASPLFHQGDPLALFRQWASRLKSMGIKKIAGDLVGDSSAFPGQEFGAGWEWDDLPHGYAAPISALQFNDNTVGLEITPGELAGTPATVAATPLPGCLDLDARIVTGAPDAAETIRIERNQSHGPLLLRGAIPIKSASSKYTVAAPRPSHYYLSALRYVLSMEGIDMAASGVRESSVGSIDSSLLWTHTSPPLSEMLKPLLKESMNLHAETLLRALGAALHHQSTPEAGRQGVERALGQMGIARGSYRYADGSGLSRHNLQNPETFVKVLAFMHRNRSFQAFNDALPIAGVDGTLSTRMKESAAAGNVRAKTGTMTGVSSISGYLRTSDGELLAFCIMADNYLLSKNAVEAIEDRGLVLLANFSRK